MPVIFPDGYPSSPGSGIYGGGSISGGGGGGVIGGGGGFNFRNSYLASNGAQPTDPVNDPRRRRSDYFGNTIAGGGGIGEQYTQAADRVNNSIRPFSYTPDYNDPELAMLHGRVQRNQSQRFLRNRDEFARAGLLGTSQMISGSDALQKDFTDELSGLDQGIFSNRRGEALGLYRDDLGFRRQAEIGRLGYLSDVEMANREREARQEEYFNQLMGGLGGGVGGLGYDYLSSLMRRH